MRILFNSPVELVYKSWNWSVGIENGVMVMY